MKTTIPYYYTSVYGERREYVAPTGHARLISALTRQKCVNSMIRELIRDLSEGQISFKECTITAAHNYRNMSPKELRACAELNAESQHTTSSPS